MRASMLFEPSLQVETMRSPPNHSVLAFKQADAEKSHETDSASGPIIIQASTRALTAFEGQVLSAQPY